MPQISDALINEIHDGNCVAFVGAGFSATVIPPWGESLSKLATQSEVATDIENYVASLVHKGSAHAFDEAAQVLEDHLGRVTFLDQLASPLTQRDEDAMSQRLTHLRGIPFRSILTTNFDTLLPGSTPGPEAYRSALRPDAFRWWETRYWGNAKGAVTLKSIFRKAAEWGYVPRDRDPAAAVTMESEGQKQPDPYTGDEVRKLLAELEPRHRRVAEVYLQTAMRLGELTRLRWADVNLEARTIAVRSPKNRVGRTIPMSKRVFDIMQELKTVNGASNTPALAVLGNGADILRPLNRAAERANIEEGRRHRMQHRLRDSAATFMLDAGVPLDRVQVILGHKTLAMTRRYAATRDEHVRARR